MTHSSDSPRSAADCARDDALDQITATLGRLRTMMGRRFISRLALSRLNEGHGLELSHFDVIKIVGTARPDQDMSVGVIAEQLRIDPSRASRVVADLVRGGSLRREASQEDARRTIVKLTDAGWALAHHFKAVHREVVGRTLDDWSVEDMQQFEQLFNRFIHGLESGLPDFFKDAPGKLPGNSSEPDE
ncbi:DNA-binding MarR family transcriptional regulator [Agrobacterium vitis]|nr:DNA-binding MarR family transcriptional regulator [Agrobacterium vitis]MBE1439798.1 DNA-binding MarR family transcriptional regulator [Agrobacterium vitis]